MCKTEGVSTLVQALVSDPATHPLVRECGVDIITRLDAAEALNVNMDAT